MLRFVGTIFTSMLLTFGCLAETPTPNVLKAGEPVETKLNAGSTNAYVLPLHAGDYVKATIEQKGASGEIWILAPDGSRLRKFTADSSKKQFSFIADVAGGHTLRVKAGEQADDFHLRIDQIEPLSERMALGTNRTQYSVPAIEALQKELPSPQAVQQFWQHVAESGTPLVTPIAADNRHQLVTFLWRGNSDTKNVIVLGSFHTRPLTDYLMDHIPDTDVWYLTVKFPTGARFVYTLSPNDPLVEEGPGPRADERMATQQADPLNPKKSWNYTQGAGIHEYSSMVELPGAPRSRGSRKDRAFQKESLSPRRSKARCSATIARLRFTRPRATERMAAPPILSCFSTKTPISTVFRRRSFWITSSLPGKSAQPLPS